MPIWLRRLKQNVGDRWKAMSPCGQRFVAAFVAIAAFVAYGALVWFRVLNDFDLRPKFATMSLTNVPELMAADGPAFGFSARAIKKIRSVVHARKGWEVPKGSTLSGLSISSLEKADGATCPSLDLIPGVWPNPQREGAATDKTHAALSLVPQGTSGCGFQLDTDETLLGMKQPLVVRTGEQVTLVFDELPPEGNGSPLTLFEHASAGEVAGTLAEPLALFDGPEVGRCPGRRLDGLGAERITIRSVELQAARATVLAADIGVQHASKVSVDRQDCRYLAFRGRSQVSFWGQVVPTSLFGVLGFLLGLIMRRRGE